MSRNELLCMACCIALMIALGYAMFTLNFVPLIFVGSVSAVAVFGGELARAMNLEQTK